MSSDAQRRAEVIDMYHGPRWVTKVNHMSDAQVFAIWSKQQDKLSKQEQENQTDEPDPGIPF